MLALGCATAAVPLLLLVVVTAAALLDLVVLFEALFDCSPVVSGSSGGLKTSSVSIAFRDAARVLFEAGASLSFFGFSSPSISEEARFFEFDDDVSLASVLAVTLDKAFESATSVTNEPVGQTIKINALVSASMVVQKIVPDAIGFSAVAECVFDAVCCLEEDAAAPDALL